MTEAISGNATDTYAAVSNGCSDGDESSSLDLEPSIMPHFFEDENTSMLARTMPLQCFTFRSPRLVCSVNSQLPEIAPEPSGGSAANPIPHDVRYRDDICRAAQAHRIDPLLLAAVAAQETGGPGSNSGANVVGADGTGHGVFQIDSGTWQPWLSKHHNGMNIAENADKAASILADNLQATGGNVRRALHLYNAGSERRATTTTQWPGRETLDYESSVERHLEALQR